METVEITIGGKPYKIPADLAAEIEAQVVEAAVDSPEGKKKPPADPAPTPAPQNSDAAKNEIAELRAKLDRLQAEKDAGKTEEKRRADRDKIEKEIRTRLTLEGTVSKILGKSFKCDGKTDRQLREAVIIKLDGERDFKADSDEYVKARFDIALDAAEDDAVGGARVDGEPDEDDGEDDEDDKDIEAVRIDHAKRQAARGTGKLKIGSGANRA